MDTGITNYGLIIDFLLFTPFLFLIRWLFPYGKPVRVSLLLIGFLLIYYAAPRFLVFYFLYWLIIWALQWPLSYLQKDNQWKPIGIFMLTGFCLALPLAPMVLWKLYPVWFDETVSQSMSKLIWALFPAVGPVDALINIIAPIGLSFSTFRALDFLIKIRIGVLSSQSLEQLLFYGFFPPVIGVGPIAEWQEIICEGSIPRIVPPADLSVGLIRIAIGCVKVFGLAFLLAGSAKIFPLYTKLSVQKLWLGLFLYAWFFYFNFSGYADLAIGAARLHGFRLKENFNNPFFQKSPQQFWANWHMSLTRFAQRNIFMPLGGVRPNRQYTAIFVTMMFIALWHAPTLPLVIFGLYHGLVMMTERYLNYKKRQQKAVTSTDLANYYVPSLLKDTLSRAATFAYVLISLPLLALQAKDIIPFYKAMLGIL